VGEYECYRIALKLRSFAGTLWQADTVLGSLAWLEALREGDGGVARFLAPFAAGDPPLVLSDGFPEGLLPRPLIHRETAGAGDLASYAKQKIHRKAEFISTEDFDYIRRGKAFPNKPVTSPWVELEFLHATINRKTGTTGGEAGNLFSTESWAITSNTEAPGTEVINIYALCKEGWKEKLVTLFRDLSLMGFGRDKSIGMGQFEFLKMEAWQGFSNFEGADGFIAFSSFVPAEGDPRNGNWALNVKYGKLGENSGSGNPFKRPFIQLKPGAVFFTGGPPKPFYGRILTSLAPSFPEAIQICYCLAVPCIYRGG